MLKELVLMGGVFFDQVPVTHGIATEWNIRCDPHAAAIVYSQRPPLHRSIGLDVTTQVTMPADEVRERFQTTLLRPVLDFAEVWFAARDEITFHDPLAATTLFRDDICEFHSGTVTVELEDGERLGATPWKAGDDGPHEVASEVDAKTFFDEYFTVVGAV